MKRVLQFAMVGLMAAEALVIGQGADVNKVLADLREALGGEKKLAAIKSLTAVGRSTRVTANGSVPNDYEMAVEFPDKFIKKEVLAVMMGSTISRTSGFNGDGLIEAMDAPPQMSGGGPMVIQSVGGGMTFGGPQAGPASPTDQAEANRKAVIGLKQDFSRLALGIFGAAFGAYPLHFTYAGQAESPDGKADILDVKGEGGFAVKLFVDTKTHMPLMLSWMAKEPVSLNIGARPGGPGGGVQSSGGATTMTLGGAPGSFSADDQARMMQDLEARRKEAEANAKVVEYRIYYGDYQKIDGVSVPMKIQRAIDGKPTEELTFDKVKLNAKIDPAKFSTVK